LDERACDECHYDVPASATVCPRCGGDPRKNTGLPVVFEATTPPVSGVLKPLGTLPFECPFVELPAHSTNRAVVRRMGGHAYLFQVERWPVSISKLDIGDVFDVGLSDDGFIAARYYTSPNDCVLSVFAPDGSARELELIDDVRFCWEGGRLWAIPTSKEGSGRCAPRFHDGAGWRDPPELEDAKEAGYTSGFITKSVDRDAYLFWEGSVWRSTPDGLLQLPLETGEAWSIDHPAARFGEGVVFVDDTGVFYVHADGTKTALPLAAARLLPGPQGSVLVAEPYFRPWRVRLGVLWSDGTLTQLSNESLGITATDTVITFAGPDLLLVVGEQLVRAFRWSDIEALPRVVAMQAGRLVE
jgi:hypothetical protein